jgi:putative component of toxin-antitoxin plasmid stabilization module
MRCERTISAYKNYFKDFIDTLSDAEARKVFYVIDMLKTQERVNAKFVKYLRDEIFELRAEHGGNIFRVFFIFDDGNVVMLFNGFPKIFTSRSKEKRLHIALQPRFIVSSTKQELEMSNIKNLEIPYSFCKHISRKDTL